MRKTLIIFTISLLALSACKEKNKDVQKNESTVKMDQTGQENSVEIEMPEKLNPLRLSLISK